MFIYSYSLITREDEYFDAEKLFLQAYFMGIGLFGNNEETWMVRRSGNLIVYFFSKKKDLKKISKLYDDLNESCFEQINVWRVTNKTA